MVTEFASKLGDLSTVVSFAALVANGLMPELLLPDGPLLKTANCEDSLSLYFAQNRGCTHADATPVFLALQSRRLAAVDRGSHLSVLGFGNQSLFQKRIVVIIEPHFFNHIPFLCFTCTVYFTMILSHTVHLQAFS